MQKYNKIYIIIVVNLLASTPVYILGMLAPNTGSRYFAMCLMPVVSGEWLGFFDSHNITDHTLSPASSTQTISRNHILAHYLPSDL